jgi:hypothetical protein
MSFTSLDYFNSGETVRPNTFLNNLGVQPKNPNSWMNKFQERAEREIALMLNNTSATCFLEEDHLVFVEDILSNYGTRFRVAIIIPDLFPFVMPSVRILEPEIHSNPHYWPNGEPCYMDPYEYDSNETILNVRNYVSTWLFAYEGYLYTKKWQGAEHDHNNLSAEGG